MDIQTLIQTFGAVGVTFYIMWLWLQAEKKEKMTAIEKSNQEQEARIKELKEIIPLLNEASNGLQDVLKSVEAKNNIIIDSINNHIDGKTIEIIEQCKNK